MRPLSVFGGIAAGMLISLGVFGAALAQDESQGNQGDDTQMIEQLGEESDPASSPPGRVAQLSYAEGSVSLEPAGTSSWTSATLNRPLTLGDKLWADQNSRAELDIGDAVVRLGSTTGVSFLNLDEQTAQMQVSAGTVIVHVRSLASGEQDEIDTPNLALTLEQPGTYRVEVNDSGDTTIVKVDEGEALATGGGQSYPVAAQQSVTFTGTTTLEADFASLGAPDSFDDWSMQRDRQQEQQASVAQQYVAPDTVGADDLGAYGTWQSTPDWGYAWFPAVPAGWAPYSVGSWVWVSPWGWTWVDAEPWGFAPFHYGRWGYWHRRWCWVPAPRRKRPIYAPALVAWVGGPHRGVRAPIGPHVGWFPLGPRDVYVPGYHVSPAYVRNINVTNTRFVNTADVNHVYETGRTGNIQYVNRAVPGAVTAVPRNVFTSAQPVGPHRVILPHQGMVDLRPTTAAPAIVPVRQSVLGVNAGRIIRAPPRALVDRPIVARLAPPRAPVSFASEQAAIRANGGRPLPMAVLARMRPNTPAAPVRLAPRPEGRTGIELRTAPDRRGAAVGSDMSSRERTLQQPTLPPAQALRNDRPAWVPGRAAQPGAPPRPEGFAPGQRQAPGQEWHVPPAPQSPAQRFAPPPRRMPEQRFAPPPRQMPEQRFAPPPRQMPEQRFAPPAPQMPEQRFAPPPRQVPEQRFAPPPRQMPEQRFAPPPRQMPEQRFAPPPRQVPQQRFTPPPREMPQERFSTPGFNAPRGPATRPAPRAAPERPPSAPHPQADRRADAAPPSFGAGYAEEQSPPPMYRPQESTIRYAAPPRLAEPADTPYRPPVSPPPMYRPIPPLGARRGAVPLAIRGGRAPGPSILRGRSPRDGAVRPRSSARLVLEHPRALG